MNPAFENSFVQPFLDTDIKRFLNADNTELLKYAYCCGMAKGLHGLVAPVPPQEVRAAYFQAVKAIIELGDSLGIELSSPKDGTPPAI